jgi:butyryl-CoA dehydrogenase
MQAVGHVVIAWLWLDVALPAQRAIDKPSTVHSASFWREKLQSARYFFEFELPKVDAWIGVVASRNPPAEKCAMSGSRHEQDGGAAP